MKVTVLNGVNPVMMFFSPFWCEVYTIVLTVSTNLFTTNTLIHAYTTTTQEKCRVDTVPVLTMDGIRVRVNTFVREDYDGPRPSLNAWDHFHTDYPPSIRI